MSLIDRIKRLLSGRNGAAAGNGSGDSAMITCHEALTVVYEFLDGELDDVSREKVQAHFEVCTRCYPHLRLEEAFRAAVQRAATGEVAPAELKSQIAALLARTS